MAELTPIVKASVMMATAVNPGDFANNRNASRRFPSMRARWHFQPAVSVQNQHRPEESDPLTIAQCFSAGIMARIVFSESWKDERFFRPVPGLAWRGSNV